MSWIDQSTVPPPRRSEEELRALVYAKAGSRGRLQGIQLLVGVAASVVLIGALVALVGHDGDSRPTELRAVSGAAPSSSAAPSTAPPVSAVPSTAPPRAVATTASGPGAASTPQTTLRQVTSTTTAPVCRNSTNARCGPFRWDPAPEVNQPLTVQVTATPDTTRAGTKVTFRVVGDDPDSTIPNRSSDFGDGTPGEGGGLGGCVIRYGPWDPPAPEPGHMEWTVEHVYTSPGTYTATFTLSSASFCEHPYGDTSTGSVKVTVTP